VPIVKSRVLTIENAKLKIRKAAWRLAYIKSRRKKDYYSKFARIIILFEDFGCEWYSDLEENS